MDQPYPLTIERDGRERTGTVRILGLGLITGAADDDPVAIGTYASAGARLGPGILWIAPAVLPMMFGMVYLAAKLGQVSGRGLFHSIRACYPRWILLAVLASVVIGNTIEAAADLGGMAASVNLVVPISIPVIVAATGVVILALQLFFRYTTIRTIFRWATLALLAYFVSAFMARPPWREVLRGTFLPRFRFTSEYLTMVVAVLGSSLSAYLLTWQSNAEVEEEIAAGRLDARRDVTRRDLGTTRRDVLIGMGFSNLVMYAVMVATGSTLYRTGLHDISTAAQAAQALRPLAGEAAGVLFALGIVSVGVLAVPVMTAGAAYDLVQSAGRRTSLHAKPHEARAFYAVISGLSILAVLLNFLGLNPMKALVWAALFQGFSTPALLFLIMRMTNDPKIMGKHVNGLGTNVLGWGTTAAVTAAAIALVVTWWRR